MLTIIQVKILCKKVAIDINTIKNLKLHIYVYYIYNIHFKAIYDIYIICKEFKAIYMILKLYMCVCIMYTCIYIVLYIIYIYTICLSCIAVSFMELMTEEVSGHKSAIHREFRDMYTMLNIYMKPITKYVV